MERAATSVDDSFEQYDCNNEFVKGPEKTDNVGLVVVILYVKYMSGYITC